MTTSTTTSTRPSRAKKPQDHKPSQAEIQKTFDETEGSQFLKPLKDIDGFQQMRIMGKLQSILGDEEDAAGDDDDTAKKTNMDFDAFADAIQPVLEGLIIDEEGFKEWNRGPGALGKILHLSTALMGELGKGMASATS